MPQWTSGSAIRTVKVNLALPKPVPSRPLFSSDPWSWRLLQPCLRNRPGQDPSPARSTGRRPGSKPTRASSKPSTPRPRLAGKPSSPPRRSRSLLLRLRLRRPLPALGGGIGKAAQPYRPTARPPVPILTVHDDGRTEGEAIRLRDARFVIGRTEGDLRFPLDGRMSARHVEITYQLIDGAHRWIVTDLQSMHGLFVRVSRTVLADKAEFLVGSGRYRFDSNEMPKTEAFDTLPHPLVHGQGTGSGGGRARRSTRPSTGTRERPRTGPPRPRSPSCWAGRPATAPCS